MPTFDSTERFRRDVQSLSPAARQRFKDCVRDEFVPAMRQGPPYPPGLRISKVQGTADVWEMTFAPDGRATFEFGLAVLAGERHIVWRRVGTHSIFTRP